MEGMMKKWIYLGIISAAFLAVVGLGMVGFLSRGATAADTVAPVSVNVNSQQGIWVNGTGTITVAPDIASINLGVSAQASTVAEALAQASTAMSKIDAALTAAGIDRKDIQTSYFNIRQISDYTKTIVPTRIPVPETAPVAGSVPGISSSAVLQTAPVETAVDKYQVDNTVVVKIRAIDKVGSIIDAVVTAGGDLTRVNGVNFSVEKPDQYYTQAREAAMKDAQAKAQQLAQLSGVNLGKAFYISENSGSQPVYYASSRYYAEYDGGGAYLSPGQMDIVLNVQVAYTIQ
jgi:uncharacterized protein